jgi:hypothetical protein
VQGRATINNSELRLRYRGNKSGNHGGRAGNHSRKYAYEFDTGGINCGMVRIIYFIADCDDAHGSFSVVPGSHKTQAPVPKTYDGNPDTETGMIGLEVKIDGGRRALSTL